MVKARFKRIFAWKWKEIRWSVHSSRFVITIVFIDTRLWKTKRLRKRFQNFHQSYLLSTYWIEIHQSQPASMTKRRLEGHTSGCDWWIVIRSVYNAEDWREFWKHFGGYFVLTVIYFVIELRNGKNYGSIIITWNPVARLATIPQKLVASGLNLVALATPQVATSSPA